MGHTSDDGQALVVSVRPRDDEFPAREVEAATAPGWQRTEPGRKSVGRTARRRPPAHVAKFVASGLVMAVILSGGALLVARRMATAEAVKDARDKTEVLGHAVVAPLIDDGVLAGDPAAIWRLDTVVRERVLGRDVVRIKVWSADGRILYSDESRLIGQVFSLNARESALVGSTGARSSLSNLSDPENVYERRFSKLLEVYLGTQSGAARAIAAGRP